VLRDGTHVTAESGANAGIGYVEGRLGRSLGAVPAGLPVAPVPGYWVATTNLWHVTVRGEYGRLVVRSRQGRPPDGTLSYVRDGRGVRLDVDGDDDTELLGRSERVSFDVSTTIVVVVPPGARGVGDTGGDADERSVGWEPRNGRAVPDEGSPPVVGSSRERRSRHPGPATDTARRRT
jgi:hypothetical protein